MFEIGKRQSDLSLNSFGGPAVFAISLHLLRDGPRSGRHTSDMTRPSSIAAVMAVAAPLAGCATALNYSDPLGPRYAGGHGVVSDADPAIRIVTFNVAYGRQIERAITCLSAAPLRGADVVLLQEMHAPGAESIARALDMNYVYYPSSVRPGERDMGTAVLSPWPIGSTEKLILPHRTRVVHRSRTATIATVRIEDRDVRIYSLHFGSPLGLSGGQRGDQAEAVLADVRRHDGPAIVAGDLNSRSVGRRFAASGFTWLTGSLRHTVGPFAFDHVFVRGLPGAQAAGVDRTCRGASDHSPVWAVVGDGTSSRQ
jgi:endonuclease/exonuclease/phosphatase family metal-dependent hydrolase